MASQVRPTNLSAVHVQGGCKWERFVSTSPFVISKSSEQEVIYCSLHRARILHFDEQLLPEAIVGALSRTRNIHCKWLPRPTDASFQTRAQLRLSNRLPSCPDDHTPCLLASALHANHVYIDLKHTDQYAKSAHGTPQCVEGNIHQSILGRLLPTWILHARASQCGRCNRQAGTEAADEEL
eukprot:2621125-Amphidinium_carterae.1